MRQLSIDQFENEGRRVTLSNQELQPKAPRPDRNGMFDRSVSDPGIHRVSSLHSFVWHRLLVIACLVADGFHMPVLEVCLYTAVVNMG